MHTGHLSNLIARIVAPSIGDAVREIRELKAQVDHLRREIATLRIQQKSQLTRELVRSTERDDDD